jgi:hypothetical protein
MEVKVVTAGYDKPCSSPASTTKVGDEPLSIDTPYLDVYQIKFRSDGSNARTLFKHESAPGKLWSRK